MANRDIIVIGASAGGVEAVSRLVAELPADLAAAVFVTIHFPRTSQSALPTILERAGNLKAVHPADGDPIRHGHIYVAPPDWHLILRRGTVHLVRGPTENGNRPAVDPMFRSAALSYGNRVIGVVLSGNLDDGTAGLYAIARRGGVGIAQDPADALFASMPTSVIEHGVVDHVVPMEGMAPLLQRLVGEEVVETEEVAVRDDAGKEDALSNLDTSLMEHTAKHPGDPSPYSCPDCGGVLFAIKDGDMMRFRCRVGHGWTNDALLLQQTETLDTALWTALRALEESAALHDQMAGRAKARGNGMMAQRFAEYARAAARRADIVRGVLARDDTPAGTPEEPADSPVAAEVHRDGAVRGSTATTNPSGARRAAGDRHAEG